jgi:predicted transcriptional regulator of viral defense system
MAMPPAAFIQTKATFSRAEAIAAGVSAAMLSHYCRTGRIRRLCRGVYASNLVDVAEMTSLPEIEALLAKKTSFVVCLLSALRLHCFTTQQPHELWVAVPQGHKLPVLADAPAPVCLQLSEPYFSYGIEIKEVEGLKIPVYSAAKTVADCFKFRNRYGLELALEALQEGFRLKKFTACELEQAAAVCRVSKIMRPYMEMLQS